MYKYNLVGCLNTQRVDATGKMPLRIRATIKRKVSYFPTGLMLLPEQWDKENKKIIQHPNKDLLNRKLNADIAKIEAEFVQQNLSGIHTPAIDRRERKDFYKYIEDKIAQNKLKFSIGTITHQYSYLRKLKAFKPTLMFAEVNEKLMYKFEEFCSKQGNSHNTISANTKFLKTHIHSAIKEGLFNGDPIKNFKGIKYSNPKRDYLTEEEIDRIEAVAIDPDTAKSYSNAANWFLFSCYTGLRYQDIADFDKKCIVNDTIVIKTHKTKEVVAIPLHDRTRAVLARVQMNVKSNQEYNRNLKAVAQLAKIKKRLTSHLGRHTMSVIWLERGGDIYDLSKMLSHQNLQVTQIYAKLTNIRLSESVKKVWGK